MKCYYRLEYSPTKQEIKELLETVKKENAAWKNTFSKPHLAKQYLLQLGSKLADFTFRRRKITDNDIETASYGVKDVDFIKSVEINGNEAMVEIDNVWVLTIKNAAKFDFVIDFFVKTQFPKALTGNNGEKAIFLRKEE